MILLLLLSAIDINIYSNKDTYLTGESVIVWWEIINTGDSVDYHESGITGTSLINPGEHLQFHDTTGREIPGTKIEYYSLSKRDKISMEEIKAGDTVKSSEKNLTGFFGSLKFTKFGILNKYIKPGEYFLSFYVYGKADRSEKIYSDTLHFFVKEPNGKEKEAWQLYKDYMIEDINSVREDKQMTYALELFKKYPESVYVESLLGNLGVVFSAYKGADMKEGRNRMQGEARKVVDYLEKNVGKFKGEERALKETVNCITHGELMLGTPKEEVRKKILQMNVPVSSEIKEVLEIKPEDLDTTKKK